jgi:hypothetical protein
VRKSLLLLGIIALIAPLMFLGCSGDDGAQGPQGTTGAQGIPGQTGSNGQDLTATPAPESCATCHGGVGDAHQAVYDDYVDSTLTATIDNVSSIDNGTVGYYNTTMLFTIKQNGVALTGLGNLASFAQKRYAGVLYNSTTRQFDNAISFSSPTEVGGGQYSVTAKGVTYKVEESNGGVYVYLANQLITGYGSSYTLYKDVVNVGKAYGDMNAYVSTANVSACEKCHGAPYRKHGYRMAKVAGLSDFAACKFCHYDTRKGSDHEWYLVVDNPLRHAQLGTTPMTADERAYYAYTANVMQDTHNSHAMEFAYPQSMANCATCHGGKLGDILTDANFTAATCKSCHPVTGGKDSPVLDKDGKPVYKVDTTKLALNTIIPHGWSAATQCNLCHNAGATAIAPPFNEIHTGFDKKIYADAAGTRYSTAFTVTIDNASIANNLLTFSFHATESPDIPGLAVTNIKPTVMVGLYGYDTKDYIVGPHESTGGVRNLEYAVGGTHPRFTTVSAAGGSWTITADLSTWADKLADGTVKRLEIAVMPSLKNADNVVLALNAPSRTFDLSKKAFDDTFFSPIVKVADGCNNCHDALGTTFHSADRGGNIVVCRLCHTTKSGGSHLEMQSRSIDSYIHSIHSFQAFDIADIDFTDPVEADRFVMHTEEHTYPNFTLTNCKSCHNAGKFNVPDQSKSLPGVLSASDNVTTMDRNIGTVPSYVTGPASRACGGCHRAECINEDNAGELAAFNQHTKMGGYLVENGDVNAVIETIMAPFKDTSAPVLAAP